MEIPVKRSGEYFGQHVQWTERMTNHYITTEPMTVYHYSDRKIDCFEAQVTCFFTEEIGNNGYIYQYIIPTGTEVFEYDDINTEIRCQLVPGQTLKLIGEREIIGRTEKNGYVKYEYETEWYTK